MGRVRITRPFVLLALAVLLAPRIEASRTGVSESNRPAAVTAARIDATSALASLAPVAAADVEITEVRRLNLGDVVLVESELEHENRFGLGSLELLGPTPLRGPPPSYPETRVRGFELLPPFRIGASPSLSLWPRQACGFSCREVVSDSRYDPWGLITSIRAETGLPADQFGTVDIESGNVLLDATVLGVFNTVASGANRIANYGANALAGLGWLQSKAEDVAVDQLGMSRADVEFANIYVATNPANAALLARGAKDGLAAAGRAADRFLAKMPVHLEPGVETPSAFGAGYFGRTPRTPRVTGTTPSGIPRVSRSWRGRYGPAAAREHHLVPQQLLGEEGFTRRLAELGVKDSEAFVHKRIALLSNEQHQAIHQEGWNDAWTAWLRNKPDFTLGDVEAQIQVLMKQYELPKSSRNFARSYGKN